MISTEGKSVTDQLDELCPIIYKHYGAFFEKLKCKVAVIGACSDIHPSLNSFIKSDFILDSWQRELLGISTKFFRIESGLKTPTDEDLKLAENAINVFKAMNDNKVMFPDGGHPGGIAHRALVRMLYVHPNLGLMSPP